MAKPGEEPPVRVATIVVNWALKQLEWFRQSGHGHV
jgi:hypothetical protein